MPQNRHTVTHHITLDQTVVDRLKRDPSLRIMLYCAATSGITQYSFLDIAFPGQLEVKVNLDEVKSNFKGLKNKPGTTKPADITDNIRKVAGYQNVLTVTYALTSKVSTGKRATNSTAQKLMCSSEILYCRQSREEELCGRTRSEDQRRQNHLKGTNGFYYHIGDYSLRGVE